MRSECKEVQMNYVKDINTGKELFWTQHETWCHYYVSDKNLKVVKMTGSKDNRTLWVESK